jgi:hypothetical protein
MTAAPPFSPQLLALCFPLEYHTGSSTAEGQEDMVDSSSSLLSTVQALYFPLEYSITQGAAQLRGRQIGMTVVPPI